MFRYIPGTGTDMGREKISDPLIHHVDKTVAATIPSAHFKILQSSVPPHWGIHKLIFHTPQEQRGERCQPYVQGSLVDN